MTVVGLGNGWGSKVVEQVVTDLRKEFPDMKGFSPSNLNSMLAFARAWPDEPIFQQLVGKLPWGHNLFRSGEPDAARLILRDLVVSKGE